MSYAIHRSIGRRRLSILLAILLAFSLMIPYQAHAATFTDTAKHWAVQYIDRAASLGLIKGYPDGTFKPDKPVTRAEFTSMLNRSLGNLSTTTNVFNDISPAKWYYNDVLKAVRAAYVAGFPDRTFHPDQNISRQEAAVMLSRIVPTFGAAASLSGYADSSRVSSWATQSMARMNGKGYIKGYSDGKIHPLDPLTRAQVARIIIAITDNERIVQTDPLVKNNGTRLANTIYSNDVTVTRDLADGDATIDNCVILGTLNVQGGGVNTVTVNHSRVVNTVINRTNAETRLLVKGESCLNDVTGYNQFRLQTSGLTGGEFGAGIVRTHLAGSSAGALAGDFPTVTLDGSAAKLTLTSGTIEQLDVNGAARRSDITVNSGALVRNATVGAESYFHGTGTIMNMQVNAANVTYESRPRNITIGSGGSAPTQVDPALTATVNPAGAETGVYRDTKITITFTAALTYKDGTTVDASDIQNMVRIRRSSQAGTSIPYTGTISSDRKVLTLTPTSALDADTRYYVVIAANMVKDANGVYNTEMVSHFTTGAKTSSFTVTYSPRDGAQDVRVNSSLTISFSEAVKKYDGTRLALNDDYLKSSVVLFRQGSTTIGQSYYSVSINSGRTVITITPNADLELNANYTIGIRSGTLRTDVGSNAVSSSSATFRTVGTPALSGATAVAYDTALDFRATPNLSGRVYAVALPSGEATPSATRVKAGQNSAGSTSTVAASTSAAVSAGTAATLNLGGLAPGTSYKICAVLDSGGALSSVSTVTATTGLLRLKSLSVKQSTDGKEVLTGFAGDKTSYDVLVDFGVPSMNVKALPNLAAIPSGTVTINSGGTQLGETTATVDLVDGVAQFTVVVQEAGKSKVTYTVNVRQRGDASISLLKVDAVELTPAGAVYTYSIPTADAATVEVYIETTEAGATFSVGGSGAQSSKTEVTLILENYAANSSGVRTVPITVISSDRITTKDYTLKLTPFTAPVPAPTP